MSEWYSAGDTTHYDSSRERLVRAWEPGDGLRCGWAAYGGKTPCGEPVAVIKDALRSSLEDKRSRRVPESVNRVACLIHLARSFDAKVGGNAEAEVERNAMEELAKAHWDEYREISDRLTNELLEQRFSVLPKPLRDRVIDLLKDGETA